MSQVLSYSDTDLFQVENGKDVSDYLMKFVIISEKDYLTHPILYNNNDK